MTLLSDAPVYAEVYDPETDFDVWYTDANFRVIAPFLAPGDTVIELGSATGLMTSMIADAGALVVGVDRVPAFVEAARRRRVRGARFVVGDITTHQEPGGQRFDHVVCTHVLHELDDPAALFRNASRLLARHGRLHLSVPNPRSAHRLLAYEMGWLEDLGEASELNRRHSIGGLPTAEQVLAWAVDAGLECVHREGVAFKPLTNAQMGDLPADVLEGFVRVAKHFPDACAHNAFVFVAS